MNRRHLVVGMFALALLTSCSVLELSPEQEVEAYLLQVAQAEAPWLAAIDRFDKTLGSTYSTRNAYVNAIEDAGLAEGSRDALDAARELTPPQTMAEDHEYWLAFREAVAEQAPTLTEAALVGDAVTILAARRALGEAEAELLLSIGREFCIHLNAVDPGEDCPPGDLPGGEYGTAVYEALRAYAIRVGPLFLTSATLDPGQRTQYLAEVQPDIETLLLDTGDRLRGLTPSSEFAADHAALVAYFDDQYQTATAITAANAIGDEVTIAESYTRSAELYDALQEALSDAVRPIVNPAF